MSRNLVAVIDQILGIAPDLSADLRSVRQSAMYTAPEIIGERWQQVADVLNDVAADHPKQEEIAMIFNGKNEARQ